MVHHTSLTYTFGSARHKATHFKFLVRPRSETLSKIYVHLVHHTTNNHILYTHYASHKLHVLPGTPHQALYFLNMLVHLTKVFNCYRIKYRSLDFQYTQVHHTKYLYFVFIPDTLHRLYQFLFIFKQCQQQLFFSNYVLIVLFFFI